MRATTLALASSLTLLLAISSAPPAAAASYNVIYSFCSTSCAQGQSPAAPLIRDSSGKLYGTTQFGGANGGGVVFRLTPGANPTTYTYTDLYDFCASSGCPDGEEPVAGLIIDSSGNLYGTTMVGGNAHIGGVVFELTKQSGSGQWPETVLYTFCSTIGSSGVCTDGKAPRANLTYAGAASGSSYDGTSLLFGTTERGGNDTANNDWGTVYALKNTSGTWSEKAINVFPGNTSNGEEPATGLVMDSSNKLWGTTPLGGSFSAGVAFVLNHGTDLWSDPWSETVIYNFCYDHSNPCDDGRAPNGIVFDGSGNIFGTATQGGVGTSPGNGLVFELTNSNCTENGVSGFWCNTVLYNFCQSTGCADGSGPAPRSTPVRDGSGAIYGTTEAGGNSTSSGILYSLSGSTLTVLHNFCSVGGSSCTDGGMPLAGVIIESNGNIYGVTSDNGSGTLHGTVFKYIP